MHLSSIAVTFSPKSRARAHSPYPRGEASSGSVSRAQSRAGSGGRRPAVTALRLTRVVIACSFGTNSSRTSFGLPKGIEALLSKLFVARPRRDDDARLRGPAAAVDRLLDAVVADIGRPSAKSAVLHSPLLRRFCADLNGAPRHRRWQARAHLPF
jgi:hypothetical protein